MLLKKSTQKPIPLSSDLLLSHQVMHTLTTIKWSLEMMQSGKFGQINEEQKDILAKVIKENESLIALSNRSLNISKIETGKYIYNLHLSSMESMVESLVNFYQEEALRKNIAVEFKGPNTTLPEVMMDTEMVKLAVKNIFDNAIKYAPVESKVIASVYLGKNGVELNIQNFGISIPKNQQKKLFKKFFRAKDAVSATSSGSGLGLFITKSIIEAHHGKIWFESEENKGATFYVTLPLTRIDK